MDKVLILTDGKAGHENQSRAFARALGCDYELVEVHFRSKLHKAASYLLDHLGILSFSLLKPSSRTIETSTASFRAVIGTGSGTFYAAKAMARKLGVPCGVVLYPRGYRLSTFNCVLAPVFDRPVKAPNVIEIPANLVASDEAFYEKGVAAFREHWPHAVEQERNLVAVIIGGPNKCSTLTPEFVRARLDRLFAEAESSGSQPVTLCVTTSRRTPPEVEEVVDGYPWAYKLLYSRDHFNPIPAFVKLARRLYVTAESTGMLSEACTFGSAEVFAIDNLNPGQHKFRRFVDNLTEGGYLSGSRKIDLDEQFALARKLMEL